MKSLKEKYTFEDWLDGKDKDGMDISPSDIIKISQAQKKAWNWAIRNRIDAAKFRVRHRIEKNFVKDPENWLRLEIQKVESFIDDNPELEMQYEQGFGYLTKQLRKIDGSFYKQAEEFHELAENGKYFDPWQDMDWQKPPIAKMYIYKEYLPFLKELKNEFDNKGGSNKKWKYIYRLFDDLAEKQVLNNEVVKKYFQQHYPEFDYTPPKGYFKNDGKANATRFSKAMEIVYENTVSEGKISAGTIRKDDAIKWSKLHEK